MRQVKVLALSVRDAQEWLMKTELCLKEEGKKSFAPETGDPLDTMVLNTADSQMSL